MVTKNMVDNVTFGVMVSECYLLKRAAGHTSAGPHVTQINQWDDTVAD